MMCLQLGTTEMGRLSPSYSKDKKVPYIPERTFRLQSAGLLVVPKIHQSRQGGRVFSYQAALLWNQLATWVQEADAISAFKIKLKRQLYC